MKLCSVKGCCRKYLAKGYCEMHYRRVRRYGSTELSKDHCSKRKYKGKCKITGCNNKSEKGNFCLPHYKENKNRIHREWYKRNKKKKIKQSLEYAMGKGKENHKRSYKKWAKANPDKLASGSLRYTCGIDLKDKENLYKAQNGCCALCGDYIKIEDMCVDHDHETGIVRGLLCHRCNRGLGQFKDDIKLLKKAFDYLNINNFSFIHVSNFHKEVMIPRFGNWKYRKQ